MSFESIPHHVSGVIGRTFDYFPSLPSTNDYLLNLDDAPSGHLVVTDHQSAGRGRGPHRWESASGDNLLFSFLLEIDTHDPVFALMPIITSLSVLESIDSDGKLNVATKWPNDVVSGEKKLCGILIESRVRGTVSRVVVGTGLNVNQRHFAPGMDATATSLSLLAGHSLERDVLLGQIVDQLNSRISHLDPAQVVGRYAARCATLGRAITFEQEGRVRHGQAIGIDSGGRLLIDEGGTTRAYAGSEVTHIRPIS